MSSASSTPKLNSDTLQKIGANINNGGTKNQKNGRSSPLNSIGTFSSEKTNELTRSSSWYQKMSNDWFESYLSSSESNEVNVSPATTQTTHDTGTLSTLQSESVSPANLMIDSKKQTKTASITCVVA